MVWCICVDNTQQFLRRYEYDVVVKRRTEHVDPHQRSYFRASFFFHTEAILSPHQCYHLQEARSLPWYHRRALLIFVFLYCLFSGRAGPRR